MPPETAKVSVDRLTKRFGATAVLQDVSFAIHPGEFLTLLGASGSGKSTLLRLIAGLDASDGGRIEIDGRDVTKVPARERGLGIVFQQYSLFPHMSVAQNIGYGLMVKGWKPAVIARRVAEMLALIRLPDIGQRRPAELSGGQQQRVALARALAIEPSLLMLDEPLGALDVQLRRQLQDELRRIHRESGTTFLLVTHDQEEALLLSDRIAVMNAGRIEQIGSPLDIYRRPANAFVADFMGQATLLPARRAPGASFAAEVAGLGLVALAAPPPAATFTLSIRPEHVRLTSDPGGASVIDGDAIFQGGTTVYTVALPDGAILRSRMLGTPDPAFTTGARVNVEIVGNPACLV